MKAIITVILGGLIIGFIGYYFGENIAIAVIGGWVLLLTNKDK